ncbi:MAG TPA: peptide chain release factor N(5)-glutamine methyltransferase [Micromonosporaceae bacterium]
MRVAEALGETTTTLQAANVAVPRVDAELLVAFVAGVARGRLHTANDLNDDQVARLRELARLRARHVPLQHLTGTAPFRHLDLAVGDGVFIPRPETELMVEWGLRWLRGQSEPADGPLVVDLCAGSGAIAASVATELPAARVVAVEREPAALAWLRRNAEPHRVRVVDGDAVNPAVLADLDGTVDLVLTNPPYLPEIGAAGLPPEVIEHEPHQALFGGADGLAVIRPLIDRIGALLRPGGGFAMEHDETHAYVVPTLVAQDGRFTEVALHHDLARRPRFTTATKAVAAQRVADLPT